MLRWRTRNLQVPHDHPPPLDILQHRLQRLVCHALHGVALATQHRQTGLPHLAGDVEREEESGGLGQPDVGHSVVAGAHLRSSVFIAFGPWTVWQFQKTDPFLARFILSEQPASLWLSFQQLYRLHTTAYSTLQTLLPQRWSVPGCASCLASVWKPSSPWRGGSGAGAGAGCPQHSHN